MGLRGKNPSGSGHSNGFFVVAEVEAEVETEVETEVEAEVEAEVEVEIVVEDVEEVVVLEFDEEVVEIVDVPVVVRPKIN